MKRIGAAVEYFPRYINKTCRQHTLDVVLLGFTVRGRGTHIMGNEQYVETPGSLGITHYGQAHDIVTGDEGIEIYNVYLDLQNHPLPPIPAALRDVLAGILPLHPQLLHRLNRRIHLQISNEQRVAQLLRGILHEQELNDASSDQMIRSYLGIFLVELCRSALRHGFITAPSTNEKSRGWQERLRQELDTHYMKPQSLPDISRRMHMNSSYLCRAFKSYAGVTITEYVNIRRIQAAIIQLRSTRDKIIHIALECGFNDLAYFNRKFKAVTGKTPSEYRAGIEDA